MIDSCRFSTTLGDITLEADDRSLIRVTIADRASNETLSPVPDNPILHDAMQQLTEYFAGTRTTFELPLDPHGTPFQRSIWSALQTIPYGSSMSYQDLGEHAGVGKAPRAVGGAVGANPLPIVIPCHRVLAADRKITGYSGGAGIPTKVALLDLEGISYR